MVRKRQQPKGFTLIELMFAMTAFTIMLVVAISGLLNAMYIYSQANVSRSNQQETRSIVDEVGRDIRSASVAVVYGTPSNLCLETPGGNVLYYVDTTVNSLRKKDIIDCDTTPPADLSGGNNDALTIPELKVEKWVAEKVEQKDGAGNVTATSIRVTLGVYRGVQTPTNRRDLEFSNRFELTSTYLLRS